MLLFKDIKNNLVNIEIFIFFYIGNNFQVVFRRF